MKMFDAANRYCRQSTWKTLAALKVCLLALGVMVGCCCPMPAEFPW